MFNMATKQQWQASVCAALKCFNMNRWILEFVCDTIKMFVGAANMNKLRCQREARPKEVGDLVVVFVIYSKWSVLLDDLSRKGLNVAWTAIWLNFRFIIDRKCDTSVDMRKIKESQKKFEQTVLKCNCV